jgi:hypothetical protein
MSEYIACVSYPARPGRIELIASCHDPRLEAGEGFAMLRARRWPKLEWTLPVVDRGQSLRALTAALAHADCGDGFFTCDPMDARSEAVSLTTLRPAPPQKTLLGRLGLRRRAA